MRQGNTRSAPPILSLAGEVNTSGVSLCLSDGLLLVPAEVRELLGKNLHFEVLRGASAIEVAAADEEPAAAGSGAAPGSAPKRPAAARWVRHRPAVLLPWSAGAPQTPLQLRLDGELMQFK